MKHTPEVHARSTIPGVKTGWSYRGQHIEQWGNHGQYEAMFQRFDSLAAACAHIDAILDAPSSGTLRVISFEETRGNRGGHKASTLRAREQRKAAR